MVFFIEENSPADIRGLFSKEILYYSTDGILLNIFQSRQLLHFQIHRCYENVDVFFLKYIFHFL